MSLRGAWPIRKNTPQLLETISRQVLLQHEFGLLSSDVVMTVLKKKAPIHTPVNVNYSCVGPSDAMKLCPTLYTMDDEGYFKTVHREKAGARDEAS